MEIEALREAAAARRDELDAMGEHAASDAVRDEARLFRQMVDGAWHDAGLLRALVEPSSQPL